MSRPHRFGHAVSAIVLASMIAGCAAPQQKTSFGGKADEDVGVATRALMALNANNVPLAIELAERAVEKSPDDAGFRALLGNAYFAGGRFWSAEAAFKDALTIYSNQPRVVLKLALVETALGKKDEAVRFLEAGRSVLDSSDYGLALALAGQPREAIAVLETAARDKGADSTVRQNLALAHALAGDWTEARTIAAQDVPANQLDSRIQQWMQLASPKSPADQVASVVGIKPAAIDHGQPIRLALRKSDTLLAQAAPAPAPAPVVAAAPAPQPQVAEAAPAPQPAFVEAVAVPTPAPQAVPAAAPAPPAPRPAPKPAIAQASTPAPITMAMIAAAAPEAPAALAAFMPKPVPVPAPKAQPAKPRRVAAVHRALRPGDSVVQLGAYRSPEYVSAAWNKLTQQYPKLRAYLPLRARFDSPRGTFWRLSIQGFASRGEAVARCQLLKAHGGTCFVRTFAGDAPVQIASR
jgi:Flp pilus assembly protein TadD